MMAAATPMPTPMPILAPSERVDDDEVGEDVAERGLVVVEDVDDVDAGSMLVFVLSVVAETKAGAGAVTVCVTPSCVTVMKLCVRVDCKA